MIRSWGTNNCEGYFTYGYLILVVTWPWRTHTPQIGYITQSSLEHASIQDTVDRFKRRKARIRYHNKQGNTQDLMDNFTWLRIELNFGQCNNWLRRGTQHSHQLKLRLCESRRRRKLMIWNSFHTSDHRWCFGRLTRQHCRLSLISAYTNVTDAMMKIYLMLKGSTFEVFNIISANHDRCKAIFIPKIITQTWNREPRSTTTRAVDY